MFKTLHKPRKLRENCRISAMRFPVMATLTELILPSCQTSTARHSLAPTRGKYRYEKDYSSRLRFGGLGGGGLRAGELSHGPNSPRYGSRARPGEWAGERGGPARRTFKLDG